MSAGRRPEIRHKADLAIEAGRSLVNIPPMTPRIVIRLQQGGKR